MGQSHINDTYDQLATFAETSYIFLMLVAQKRRLTEDEIYILDRAAKAAALLRPDSYSMQIHGSVHCGEYRPN